MKRVAISLALATLSLTVAAHAAIFRATLQPSGGSTAGGGAYLTVNLSTRSWGLSGEISNLVFSATSAGILAPTQPGQPAPAWIPLSVNAKPKGPLAGAGVFTEAELDWLQQGLLSLRVSTDPGRFPEGELNGPFTLVPEPGAMGAAMGAGLCAFAGYRRRMRAATSSSNAGTSTSVAARLAWRLTPADRSPVPGVSHSTV
jgi:hypothetical protein